MTPERERRARNRVRDQSTLPPTQRRSTPRMQTHSGQLPPLATAPPAVSTAGFDASVLAFGGIDPDLMSAAFRPDIAPVQAQAQPQSAARRAPAGQPDRPDEVHAAARGTQGPAQALPYRAEIEAATGRDLAGVKAHIGGPGAAAAEAIGAQAYATGDHVVFRQHPSLALAAHEATHVLQQRGGVQLSGGVGRAGDAHERQADQVARRIVAGQPAVDLVADLAPSANASTASAGPVQKWGADEHRELGAAASGGAMVTLAPDYQISYGQMVALAGDHFESIEQMRRFATRPDGAESRGEIEYAIQWKQLAEPQRPAGRWNDDARIAQEARYYALATGNLAHFLNPEEGDEQLDPLERDKKSDPSDISAPGNAGSGYRNIHSQAIYEAACAALKGEPIDGAMATEAFSSHYLTDAFAGGHIRTKRKSISEHWNPRVPMFNFNMKGYIAERIAREMPTGDSVDLTYAGFDALGADGALDKITAALDAKAYIQFGDVVAGAIHDRDNSAEYGVRAEVDFQGWTRTVELAGDGHLKPDQKQLIEQIVAASIEDIRTAYKLAKAGVWLTRIDSSLQQDGLYVAERAMPKALPDEQQGTAALGGMPAVRWDYDTVDELLSDWGFRQGVELFGEEKADELRTAAFEVGEQEGRAMERSVVADFEDRAIMVLRDIIDWTPGTGGGVMSHNRDDHSVAYWQQAKNTPGGLASLTYMQRRALIEDLLGGLTIGSDEDAIMSVLETASDSDARALIGAFGWQKLHDNVDDWFGEQFAARFPRSSYGE